MKTQRVITKNCFMTMLARNPLGLGDEVILHRCKMMHPECLKGKWFVVFVDNLQLRSGIICVHRTIPCRHT